jgi:hypothetical protein
MCGIGRDEQNRSTDFRKLDGEGAGRGGLSYPSFAADKDPAERFLVEDRLESGLELIIVGVDYSGRHSCEERAAQRRGLLEMDVVTI